MVQSGSHVKITNEGNT